MLFSNSFQSCFTTWKNKDGMIAFMSTFDRYYLHNIKMFIINRKIQMYEGTEHPLYSFQTLVWLWIPCLHWLYNHILFGKEFLSAWYWHQYCNPTGLFQCLFVTNNTELLRSQTGSQSLNFSLYLSQRSFANLPRNYSATQLSKVSIVAWTSLTINPTPTNN